MNWYNQKQNSLQLVLRKRIGWAPEGLHTAALLLCRIQGNPLQLQSVFTGIGKKTSDKEPISLYLPLSFSWLLMPNSIAEGIELHRSNNRIRHGNLLRQSVIKVNLFFHYNVRLNRYNTYLTAATQRNIPERVYSKKDYMRDAGDGTGTGVQHPIIEKRIKYRDGSVFFQPYFHALKWQTLKPIIMQAANKSIRQVVEGSRKGTQQPAIAKAIQYDNESGFIQENFYAVKRQNLKPILRPLIKVATDGAEKVLQQPSTVMRIKYREGAIIFQTHVHDLKRKPVRPMIMPLAKETVRDVGDATGKGLQKPTIMNRIKYAERVFRSSPTLLEQASKVSDTKAHSPFVTLQSGSAVERLFEIGMASQPIQGLKLHDISSNETAIANAIEKKVANSALTLMNNSVVQNKHEIHQLADKVSRILQQRERFERERKGQF